jgi:hypothetical protein
VINNCADSSMSWIHYYSLFRIPSCANQNKASSYATSYSIIECNSAETSHCAAARLLDPFSMHVCVVVLLLRIVIDRKRIFLFRPKTNIRQENAAEYSADNKYSAQCNKHLKKSNLQKDFFSRVAVANSG